MKKISISLLFLFIFMPAFGYKITNSPASTLPITVTLTKTYLGGDLSLNRLAMYRLKPGQSGSWNQKEIRKNLKVNELEARIHKIGEGLQDPFQKYEIPIDANLEILMVGERGGDVIGGAIDYSTRKIYNLVGLDRAIKIIKKYYPQKARHVAGMEALVKHSMQKSGS